VVTSDNLTSIGTFRDCWCVAFPQFSEAVFIEAAKAFKDQPIPDKGCALGFGPIKSVGAYADEIMSVLDSKEKTIVHIPNVNSRESIQDKHKKLEHIIEELGQWLGVDEKTGFHMVKTGNGRTLRVADLVDDEPKKRDKVANALKDPKQKNNRDHVDIIIALGMAKEGFDWIWC